MEALETNHKRICNFLSASHQQHSALGADLILEDHPGRQLGDADCFQVHVAGFRLQALYACTILGANCGSCCNFESASVSLCPLILKSSKARARRRISAPI